VISANFKFFFTVDTLHYICGFASSINLSSTKTSKRVCPPHKFSNDVSQNDWQPKPLMRLSLPANRALFLMMFSTAICLAVASRNAPAKIRVKQRYNLPAHSIILRFAELRTIPVGFVLIKYHRSIERSPTSNAGKETKKTIFFPQPLVRS